MKDTVPREIFPKPGWLIQRKKEDHDDDELHPILIMKNFENYKLAVEVEYIPGTTRPMIAILDSGASFNIIYEQALPKGWEETCAVDLTGTVRNLQDASGNISQNINTIYLNVKIGIESKYLRFLVVKELAVPIILGCEFLDEHVASIHSKTKTLELLSGRLLPLHTKLTNQQFQCTPVYVSQSAMLSPFSETNVLMRTDNEGTCFIQAVSQPQRNFTRSIILASGVTDISMNQPFILRVANYGPHPIHLQKHRAMGLASPLNEKVLTISEFNL
jgi:Retroviral aspartyl protease